MIHLASLPEGERQSLPQLAAATDAPESFLAKILQALSRAGLILARRGKIGGFELLPIGRQASMRDVIEAMEGPLVLNVCLLSGDPCERKHQCPSHRVWVKAQEALLNVLGTSMISELAAERTPQTVNIDLKKDEA
jgi:Rrf2 family protein